MTIHERIGHPFRLETSNYVTELSHLHSVAPGIESNISLQEDTMGVMTIAAKFGLQRCRPRNPERRQRSKACQMEICVYALRALVSTRAKVVPT
jgi:hypothetical protein